jgi:hypothetical protein
MPTDLENVTLLAAISSDNQLRDLIVRWDPTPYSPSPEAAARIDSCWNYQLSAAQSAGHTLFNGPITRLIQVSSTPTSITLRLGPADYKAFLATCLRDRTWFQTHAPEAMVEALGNSALVTRGKQALLALRAPGVSAYPGRWHLIGGVVDGLDTPKFPAARSGLEAHLRQELSEELNLSIPELRPAPWPRPLALARDEFLSQPELFWQWDLRVPLESVIQNLDPAEHSDAKILRKNDMTPDLFEQLTPVARLAWQMWCDQ